MTNEIGRRFARLTMQVLDDAQSVDHTQLLLAANAFLDVTPPSSDEDVRLAREMAHAAMELGVFMMSAHWAKLRRVALAYHNQGFCPLMSPRFADRK